MNSNARADVECTEEPTNNLIETRTTKIAILHFLKLVQQCYTSSIKVFACSSQPGSVFTKAATSSIPHFVTSLPTILDTPGSNLECCSQHSGSSFLGVVIIADINTELWISWRNASSEKNKEKLSSGKPGFQAAMCENCCQNKKQLMDHNLSRDMTKPTK